MADILISVRGEAERRLSPELATVHAAASADGPQRDDVVAHVTTVAARLRDGLSDAEGSGAVREWSSGSTSVWSDRPWNADGDRLPLVHHASIEVVATFSDVDALAAWLGAVSDDEAVRVSHVEWGLTPETRARVEQEVATAAIAVAVARATDYAAALGRSSVEAAEIADTGLLGAGAPSGPPAFARAALMSADAAGAAFDLRPADIVVTSTIEGRFIAH